MMFVRAFAFFPACLVAPSSLGAVAISRGRRTRASSSLMGVAPRTNTFHTPPARRGLARGCAESFGGCGSAPSPDAAPPIGPAHASCAETTEIGRAHV